MGYPSDRSSYSAAPPPQPTLVPVLREHLRVKHYSLRTEQSYAGWICRFIRFHGRRHPREMGAAEDVDFGLPYTRERGLPPDHLQRAEIRFALPDPRPCHCRVSLRSPRPTIRCDSVCCARWPRQTLCPCRRAPKPGDPPNVPGIPG
jgi:hypothetical protein